MTLERGMKVCACADDVVATPSPTWFPPLKLLTENQFG
jgi:hypothetical protein